jgi:hypothetical protein
MTPVPPANWDFSQRELSFDAPHAALVDLDELRGDGRGRVAMAITNTLGTSDAVVRRYLREAASAGLIVESAYAVMAGR